jgi:hypothetical protein
VVISRDDLRKARPDVDSATIRYLRGEITRAEYERQVERERRDERRPPAEQTSKGG